ncbi:MAG: murein hydrolase activator EnvC family protein [Hyphomicrobiaceae bacterium]
MTASVLALGLLAWPSVGQAQTSEEVRAKLQEAIARREKARASLQSNRKYLDENRERAGAIKEEMARLNKERAELNADLIRSGEKVKQTEAKMTAIEGRLGKLEEQERALRTSLNAQHRSIGRLLSAIQRMGRNPPPVMITRRSDALAMVRSAMLLARAFPKLRSEALTLSRQLNRLVALMSGIRTESERLRTEAKALKDAQTRLSYLMQTKRKSFGDRKVELAEVHRTVKVIGGTVNNLEDLIRKLGPAIDRNTRLGRKLVAEERRKAIAEAKAAAAARDKAQAEKLKRLQLALNVPKKPVPPAAGVRPENAAITTPSASAIKPSFNLTPKGGAFIGDSARITPAIPFHLAKGRLPLPAAGSIETHFGEPVKFGGRSKGIKIKTRHGAQITSPADGWVVYAGKFRTYGQIVIIKTGKGYHVLLAGLSRIDVQSGQFVLAAEPVGTMKSAPGARSGANSPRLYVEFRKDGRPINPRPWWSASSKQKVQG